MEFFFFYLICFRSQVIQDMEKLRQIITSPSSLKLFIAADAAKLQQDAHSLISQKLLPANVPMVSHAR